MTLTGCFVAITTPFTGGKVDEQALASHASWLVDQGVQGIVVCGTTGESATMSDDEKLRAMHTIVESVGARTKVVAGAGNNCTAESLAFLKLSNQVRGLDAIMSVVPYYNKPNQRGILAHFKAVCDASTHPVVLYNVPGRTVVGTTAETMVKALSHSNVIAAKEASGDLHLGSNILRELPEGRTLLSGDDVTSMPFMACGGHGVVSVVANFAPKLVSELCASTMAGDLSRAQALHAQMVPLHELAFSDSNPLPTKAIVSQLGFGSSDVRLPLPNLLSGERDAILSAAANLGVLG